MSLLQKLIKENPGIEKNKVRGETLFILLGVASESVGIAEEVIKRFTNPLEIRSFYQEYIDFVSDNYRLSPLGAKVNADNIIGYATASSLENRKIWMETLEDITHPILGRRLSMPEGRVITEAEVTFRDLELLELVETLLEVNKVQFLMADFSYEISSPDPIKIKFKFNRTIDESERGLCIMHALIDGLWTSVYEETGKKINYEIKWSSQELERKEKDVQAYWEEKLNYLRLRDSWFKEGIINMVSPLCIGKERQNPPFPELKESNTLITNAYIGQHPGACSDGTSVPHGLHLQLKIIGEWGVVGWSFVGDQIKDFLKASNVQKAEDLINKEVKIYEVWVGNYMIVGIQAYKPKKEDPTNFTQHNKPLQAYKGD